MGILHRINLSKRGQIEIWLNIARGKKKRASKREREREREREKGNRIYGLKITTTLGKFMWLVRFEILDA